MSNLSKPEIWKSRLLDLSRRNRLLYLRPGRRGQAQIVAPDADTIFAALVHQNAKLEFLACAPPAPASESEPVDAPVPTALAAASNDSALPPPWVEREPALDVRAPLEIAPLEPADAEPAPDAPPRTKAGADGAAGKQPGEPSPTVSPDPMQSGTTPASADGEPDVPLPAAEERSPARLALQTNLSEAELAKTLYTLRARARSALEEQGVNILYLSFGVLGWLDGATNERMVSPLLLVPVQLDGTALHQPVALQMRDEDILLNPTLAQKLLMDYRISLPRIEEGEGLSPGAVFDAIRSTLRNLPSWMLSPDVYLELYSFEKLVMLKDLELRAAEMQEHPFIAAMAGDLARLPPLPPDLPRADELDARVLPADTFQPLDADSSQQLAIEWAKRGVSFVMEGPPGTGKSQTIANILCEALAQNKKALFVSAKMAALEVVYKRLADCGLEHLALEAHSHRASRGAIVAELGRALHYTCPEEEIGLDGLARLAALRAQLNEYARALHAPVAPLEQTPFRAQSELAALTDAPDLVFDLPALAQIDALRVQAIQEALDNLTAFAALWASQNDAPWRGVELRAYSLKTRTDVEFHLGELANGLAHLEIAGETLADALSLPVPQTLPEMKRLAALARQALTTPAPPSDWFRAGQTDELRALLGDARERTQAAQRAQAEFLERYTPALLERTDLDALAARLDAAQRNSLRVFDSQYRADLHTVYAARRAPGHQSASHALRVVQQALALQQQQRDLEGRQPAYRAKFGRLYQGPTTDWSTLEAALDWVDQTTALSSPDPLPESFIHLVCNRPARLEAARPALDELETRQEQVGAEWTWFARLLPAEGEALAALPLAAVRARLAAKLNHMDELEPWILFQNGCAELERLGLGAFLAAARAARLDGDQLKPAFLKRFYHLWLDHVAQQQPILNVGSALRQKLVAQFCRDDRQQLDLARQRLVRQQQQARPSAHWHDAPSSEVTLLKRELAKRKHHKSIRRLFADIPNLLLALKPCLMMSPLSVSQYLASAPIRFDLVIFDEASQIPPEEAVAAIVRAKQVIVAGDHEQLPPTPFFQALGGDENDDEGAWGDTLESILQEAAVVLPSTRLEWHYRSRHAALLDFSNHHLYQDRLITFPNAAHRAPLLGVEYVHVPDGVYDRAKTRTNAVEARRVAALVAEHFTHTPQRSLGIVTFSQSQREQIDLECQLMLRAQPQLEPLLYGKASEPFFVKSLENVQGDERDVIFLSVGYGRDAEGHLSLNMGPLNGDDGARRLNVAITRAREQVKLVSSLLPADLDVSRIHSRGVQLLRAYMDYVRRGGWAAAPGAPSQRPDYEVQLVASIQRALQARGLTVQTFVGARQQQIELAILDPENPSAYALGIKIEGTTFGAAKTARDRERLAIQALEGLGWKMYRLGAYDWIANPDDQIARILHRLGSLDAPLDAWSIGSGRANGRPARTAAGEHSAGGALVPTGMALYAPAALERQGLPEQFYRSSERTLEELFLQVAQQEGPVHWNAAVRRIAACWGITRVTPSMLQTLDAVLSNLIEREAVVLRDDFLWAPSQGQVVVRLPAPGQEPRPMEEIALEEISKAAYLNVKNALSLTEPDLVAQTARLLGYPRAGERARRRIQTAIARLEEGGLARRNNGKLELESVAHA